MNKNLCILRIFLPFCFGVFCIYFSFSFIFDFGTLNNIFIKMKTPHVVQAFVIIAISGIGLELGFKYIHQFKEEHYLLWFAVLFSVSMFIFQTGMTVVANTHGCACETLMEIIENISDWHRAENAGILLVLAIASTIVILKVKREETT